MSFPIPYTLIPADRKSIGIRILQDGTLEVRASRYVRIAEIEKVLYTKEAWIREHRNRILSIEHTKWQYGSKIPCLGGYRTVTATEGNTLRLTDTEILIPAGLSDSEIVEAVKQLYIAYGKTYLAAETNRMAGKYGLSIRSVTVNRAAKRWGSCTVQTGRIHYSWRLMCVSEIAIEYVITHELAHLLHPDHSPAFWHQVKNWLPDFEKRRAKLREYETYFMGLEGV